MGIDRNRMSAVVEIGRNEGECRTGYAKVGGESGEKNVMIYGIKGRREIKKNKSGDLLLVDGEKEIIVDHFVDHCGDHFYPYLHLYPLCIPSFHIFVFSIFYSLVFLYHLHSPPFPISASSLYPTLLLHATFPVSTFPCR